MILIMLKNSKAIKWQLECFVICMSIAFNVLYFNSLQWNKRNAMKGTLVEITVAYISASLKFFINQSLQGIFFSSCACKQLPDTQTVKSLMRVNSEFEKSYRLVQLNSFQVLWLHSFLPCTGFTKSRELQSCLFTVYFSNCKTGAYEILRFPHQADCTIYPQLGSKHLEQRNHWSKGIHFKFMPAKQKPENDV
jgi:hypothetical protein